MVSGPNRDSNAENCALGLAGGRVVIAQTLPRIRNFACLDIHSESLRAPGSARGRARPDAPVRAVSARAAGSNPLAMTSELDILTFSRAARLTFGPVPRMRRARDGIKPPTTRIVFAHGLARANAPASHPDEFSRDAAACFVQTKINTVRRRWAEQKTRNCFAVPHPHRNRCSNIRSPWRSFSLLPPP
jgi:hypothetical protein